jgi:glycosyltransferase involved in cell wall biosynthesis
VRLLLAVHAFPPRSTAGVEVYTLRLARALRARGHDLLVLSAVHDLAAEPYATRRRLYEGLDVVEVVNVHHRGTLEATYDDPGVDRAVAPLLREFRPDCVHVQHLVNLSRGLVSAARGVGARVVFTLHDYWLSCPRDGLRMRADLALCATMDHDVCARCLASSPYLVPPLQRGLAGSARRLGLGRHLHLFHARAPRFTGALLALLRRAAPGAEGSRTAAMDRRAQALRTTLDDVDVVLAPTSFARDRAVEFGVGPAKARVLPLGVLRSPARARAAGRRRRVGFVGTVAPHKGAHVLVEAFRGLDDPEVTLGLHGSEGVQPSYAASLRRVAASDPRIRFHGPFPESEQERVLREMDVLVQPSVWWENSPLTVLEALGGGLPVIASNTGGVPELLAEENAGVLVPPGDVKALRDTLAAVAAGRLLAEARAPLSLKTAAEHAAELEAIYAGP